MRQYLKQNLHIRAVEFPPSLRLFVYLTGLVEEGHRGDQMV
jgi:hypothetical protein